MNFARLAQTYIHRSVFHDKPRNLLSFNGGDLVPIFWDEVYPGDTYKLSTKLFMRFSSPLVAPIFDNVYVDTFWFFIPNRLVWSHWQNFMGEQDTPYDPDEANPIDYLEPQVTAPSGGFGFKSLADYFGARPGISGSKISALPFRAYNLVYNEWFRPEYLIDAVAVPMGDSDDISNYSILKRAKRADYFTRALPWPQRGPAVSLNLTGSISAPVSVYGNGNALGLTYSDGSRYFAMTNNNNLNPDAPVFYSKPSASSYEPMALSESQVLGNNGLANSFLVGVQKDPSLSGLAGTATVNLSDSTAITISSLRTAFQVQKLYEADARGGTRYTEIIRQHFGTVSPDARLQRPEYLGGNSSRMLIETVVQNSSTVSNNPLGQLAAFGLAGSHSHGFTKSFTEHGHVLGLINVRTDLTYQQGTSRLLSRRTRFDYYWPVFAHLSEQPVLRKEIYTTGTAADDEVFGYQERYAELRYYPSQIHGELRSDYAQSLDVWHLAEDFESNPTLSQTFIENPAQTVLDRVLTVKSNVSNQIIADLEFDMYRTRPLPMFGTPGLVDHF